MTPTTPEPGTTRRLSRRQTENPHLTRGALSEMSPESPLLDLARGELPTYTAEMHGESGVNTGMATLRRRLLELAEICVALADEGRRSGWLLPTTQTVLRWRCESFAYTERGVVSPQVGDLVPATDWWEARSKLLGRIESTDAYGAAITEVEAFSENRFQARHAVDAFLGRLACMVLPGGDSAGPAPREVLEHFLRELGGEPMEYRARAYLEGLVVLCGPVSFGDADVAVRLRAPGPADIETETYLGGHQPGSLPTAVMEFALRARTPRAAQKELERVVEGLRLYRVASVAPLRCAIDTDAVLGLGWRIEHRFQERPAMEVGVLGERDLELLPSFLGSVLPALPSLSSSRQTSTSWEIARTRFCDSLFVNGPYEQRVASGVMALEALLLGGDDKRELSFKLAARSARLLGRYGEDPETVFHCLRLAYDIRSQYVHGSVASPRDTRRVRKDFGDEGSFVRRVLEMTRKMLLICILVRCDKKDLIKAVDRALVSGSFTGTGIENDLSAVSPLIAPS